MEMKMKLLEKLDKAIDDVIELSKPFGSLTDSVTSLASAIEKLASNLAIIAHNQAIHHQMIQQMWGVHQVLVKQMHDRAGDMAMPSPSKKKDDKIKPN
jgi:phage-related minor tail protein